MADAPATVLLDIAGPVARLTLNRPHKLNCFTGEMHRELREVLTLIEEHAGSGVVRALLITGAGKAFCAGQDLAERRRQADEPAPDLERSLLENYNPLLTRIGLLPIPVVAAVNGAAAGSGANLALAWEGVVASRSAVFSQPFARIGLVPDAGGSWILPRLIGMARAKAMTFLAEPMSAVEAEACGLIWKVVDDEQLQAFTARLVDDLASKATRSFALQKIAYAAAYGNSWTDQLALEAKLQGIAGRTADYTEGVASFFDKRPARFNGR